MEVKRGLEARKDHQKGVSISSAKYKNFYLCNFLGGNTFSLSLWIKKKGRNSMQIDEFI